MPADGTTQSPTSFATEALLNDNRPTLRPGERLVAGKPYVYDADALGAHIADERIAAAPADLTTLTDSEVSTLWGAWLNADRRRRREVEDFGRRICTERHNRPMSAAERGVA
jgi:hypothetical protein